MSDQTHNLNPCREAYLAMILWGEEYAQQRGGCMDFWNSLPEIKKRQIRDALERIDGLPSECLAKAQP